MKRLLNKFMSLGPDGQAKVPQRQRLTLPAEDYAAIYAIGDVHGCLDELLDVENRIVRDAAGVPGRKLIVMLGDYIDRGGQSRQVLAHLCEQPPAGLERVLLCGNHDDVFLQFIKDPQANMGWLRLGGLETLLSYGIDTAYVLERGGAAMLEEAVGNAVPAAHVELLRSLPAMVSIGQLVFVHAGLKPGTALEAQSDEDLLWIREPFLSVGPRLPVFVVHGHTPAAEPVFGPGRLCIDTGAYSTGKLCIARIIGDDIVFL